MAIHTKTIAILAALAAVPALVGAEVIFNVGFDNHPLGTYTRAMAQADFPGATWYSGGIDSGWAEVVPGRAGRGNALRVLYKEGMIGSASAIQIKARFPSGKAADTAWASYWVKFDDGFDFVRGGKLPGLCGNQCITGGNDANGYNGWSARIMWRNEGVATQYMYYVTNQGYGEDLVFDKSAPEKRFIPGKWHRVNTQIIMNTPGIANGTIRSWFDGELSMERNNILIRHTDTLKITEFYISTFFGGSDPSWAPSADMFITYDDFVIMTNQGPAPEPQLLYNLSATSGRVPASVTIDLTASQNISPNGFDVDFGGGTNITSSRLIASARYTDPGIYNISASVSNSTQSSERQGRRFFALGQRDLLSNRLWERMPLGDTLRNGDTLRMYLTVVETEARIITGPVNTSDPGNLTQPQEALFYGVFEYQNGTISACDGNPCTYRPAPGTHSAGTYELVFTLHGTATALNTYGLAVYNTQGDLIHQWENLARRGFAQSGQISNYATWATRDQAAVAHMEPWEKPYVANINTKPETVKQLKKSPTVTARKNAISLSIPAALPSAQTASAQSAQIEIYNAKGSLVRRVSANGKTNILIPVKARGLYLYRIRAGNDVFRGSVVVR